MPPENLNTNQDLNQNNNTNQSTKKPVFKINVNPEPGARFVGDPQVVGAGKPKLSTGMVFLIIIILLFATAGLVLASNISFFSKAPYKENDLFSGLLQKIPEIKSGEYTFSLRVYTEDREEGVDPFKNYFLSVEDPIIVGDVIEPDYSLEEMIKFLPSEFDISGSIMFGASWKDENVPVEWIANLDGAGYLEDLSYKINIDLKKKGQNYYFNINNLPSLFSYYAPLKGQWIRIESEKDVIGDNVQVLSDIELLEQEYSQSKEEIIKFFKKITNIADQERVYEFKNKPKKENVEGTSLYKYELRTNKDALVSFYEKLIEEARETDSELLRELSENDSMINHLKSDEFANFFDYLDRNTWVTLWVDDEGFPVIYESVIRIVPPESAVNLKNSQIKLIIKMELDSINEDIKIEEPVSSKSLEEIYSDYTF